MKFSPLLGYNPPARRPIVLEELRYPLGISAKHDGFRTLVRKRKAVSRYLKPVRNLALARLLQSVPELECCDGEIIYGDPTDPESFRRTSSLATTRDAGTDGVGFYLFDWFGDPMMPFRRRYKHLQFLSLPKWCHVIHQVTAHNPQQARDYEDKAVRDGFEGMMARELEGLYKFGRSTLNEQLLLKIKRMEDSEAVVEDILPKMKNTNEAVLDALGHSKRSSRKEGKVAVREAGSLLLRDVRGLHGSREFSCSPGVLTQPQKVELWEAWSRGDIKKLVVKYRFQPAGTGELPRFPRLHAVLSGFKFRSA